MAPSKPSSTFSMFSQHFVPNSPIHAQSIQDPASAKRVHLNVPKAMSPWKISDPSSMWPMCIRNDSHGGFLKQGFPKSSILVGFPSETINSGDAPFMETPTWKSRYFAYFAYFIFLYFSQIISHESHRPVSDYMRRISTKTCGEVGHHLAIPAAGRASSSTRLGQN